MNEDRLDRLELGRLITLLCDGVITAEEMACLEQMLRDNAAAQAFYHEYLAVDGELTWGHGAPAPAAPSPGHLALDLAGEPETGILCDPHSPACPVYDLVRRSVSGDARPRRRWRAAVLTALAASLLLALGWLFWAGLGTRPFGSGGTPHARIIELVGTAEVLTASGETIPGAVGQQLEPGQTVRVGSDTSCFAVIEYADQTRLELLADTVARLSLDEPGGADPGGKMVFLSRGLIRADVTRQAAGQPMLLTTPHAKIRILGTRFVSAIGSSGTRIEMEHGLVEVVRQADGQSVRVKEGSYVEASSDPELAPMVARPLPELVSQPWNLLRTSARTLAFSSDGTQLALVWKDRISLWDLNTWSRRTVLPEAHRDLRAIVFGPDDQTLLTAGRDPLGKVWALPGGAELASFRGRRARLSSLGPGPLGRSLFWVEQDRTQPTVVKRWDPVVEEVEEVGSTPLRDFECLALSPDGHVLVGGTRYGELVFWSLTGAREGQEAAAHPRRIQALAFSPDGRWLASGGQDGVVKVWSLSSRTVHRRLEGQGRQIVSLAFAPDSSILAVGRNDGTVKLWDPVEGREMAAIAHARSGNVTCLAFAPHGRILLTAIPGKPIYLWNVGGPPAPAGADGSP